MVVNFKQKLKGSTIIEVLIAMAILTFCSSLAVVIYLNIQKSSLPFHKLKALELAEQSINSALLEKKYTDESVQHEEFNVKTSFQTNEAYPDCYLLRVLVFDGNKKKILELEQSVLKLR